MLKAEEGRKYIIENIPELELIENNEFKEAVINIWQEVLEKSEFDDINDIPKSSDVMKYSNLEHTRSVTQQVTAVADIIESMYKIEVNRDILITASLLHDISKFIEYNSDGTKTEHGKLIQHGFYSAFLAEKYNLPIEIQHLIISHTGLSKIVPQTTEAIILHYADFLDSDILLHDLKKSLFLKK